ncbi:unnamed protein product [Alternaria alternata]
MTDFTKHREKLDQNPEKDLEELWKDAQKDFFGRTGYTLDGVTLRDRLEREMDEVMAIRNPGKDKSEKSEPVNFLSKAFFKDAFDRAKGIFKEVFKVLWRFSSFLVPAAEKIPIVGAGVSFLVQAIELLIQTTQDYRDIFIKAGQLFVEAGFFTMRFEILMEAQSAGAVLPPQHVHLLNRILASTVECVALFIQLTQETKGGNITNGTEKLKCRIKAGAHATKQYFSTMATGDDAGVSDHMLKLQGLIEQEGKLSTTLILASVLKIHTDVVAVRGSVSTMSDKLDLVHEKISEYNTALTPSRVERLKTLFSVDQEPWYNAFRVCAERCVPNTGAWLLQHEKFKAWTTTHAHLPQILTIEAASRSGKTYLATIAITYLHERVLDTSSARLAVAFYYFDKVSKELTADTIIKSIAYQLCTQNPVFLDRAFALATKSGTEKKEITTFASNSTFDFRDDLIVELFSEAPDSVSFVVFDGLEFLDDGQLHSLASVLASLKRAHRGLRILLTGNVSALKIVVGKLSHSLTAIALDSEYPNHSDVLLVTEAKLARCDFFADSLEDPEVRKYLASIRNRLAQAVSGDYYVLQSQIDEIQHLQSKSEIDRVLSRANNNREATIKRHLSNLAVRLSKAELKELRIILHFLAVLDRFDAPMPHASALDQYLSKGKGSVLSGTKVQSAYSGLLSADNQGCISLATEEMKAYLLRDVTTSQKGSYASETHRHKQLNPIKHLLDATFNETFLNENGIDEEFYESRKRLSKLSKFIVDRNLAMAKVAIRFIVCLSSGSSTQNRSTNHQQEPSHDINALAREVLPELLKDIDMSKLDDKLKIELGTETAPLFFNSAVADLFWQVEASSQVRTTWGEDDELFGVMYRVVSDPAVIQSLKAKPRSEPWAQELQTMSGASGLKIAVSRMIATRWLLSNIFWTQSDIEAFFPWFATVPSVGLINEAVREEPYDQNRTKGWFTPPNWRKIEAWVAKECQPDDSATFAIQKAAVDCALGGARKERIQLLEPYSKTEWLALAWLAEALSLIQDHSAAFDAVEQCLDLVVQSNTDPATVQKIFDCFLDWTWQWHSSTKDLQIREKMVELNRLKPGIVSAGMWADTLMGIVQETGWEAGFDYLEASIGSRKATTLEMIVRRTSNNHLHIALSWMLKNDPEGKKLQFLKTVYKDAIELCGKIEAMSLSERTVARVRLTFWLGRLFFISDDKERLSEAIAHWEGLVKELEGEPTAKDLDMLLPIVTHLCSAYLQTIRQPLPSLEADRILSKVTRLYNIFSRSGKSIAIKIRFRVALCLARVYVLRGEPTRAREVLQEHAESAFAMLSQVNNKPLHSIGWIYLASTLTVLDEDPAWQIKAWSKVRLYQPTRWDPEDFYGTVSKRGDNPLLKTAVAQKIEAIKAGEEYTFFDGIHWNNVGCLWVDDSYLPSFATMMCDGRACKAKSASCEDQPTGVDSYLVQFPAGIWFNTTTTPAQDLNRNMRITFRVCRDCMLSKLCVTCSSSLGRDGLKPMGCKPDHNALIVPGMKPEDYGADGSTEIIPYAASKKDMELVKVEAKKWNIDFEWRV